MVVDGRFGFSSLYLSFDADRANAWLSGPKEANQAL
jgi:hypothetical protein